MANIIKVDYEAMPRQASAMRAHGKELNNEIVSMYNSISDMRKSWFGQRYNTLAQEFNKIIPSLNELLTLVVDEIPYTIEVIANNYSLADRGTGVTKAAKELPQRVSEIAISQEVGMKFVTSEVEAVQQSVTKSLQNSKEKMNTIETEYLRITWQSEASDAFKARFSKLKAEIINSFENLSSQFTNLMNQTKEDVQKTESANTLK